MRGGRRGEGIGSEGKRQERSGERIEGKEEEEEKAKRRKRMEKGREKKGGEGERGGKEKRGEKEEVRRLLFWNKIANVL